MFFGARPFGDSCREPSPGYPRALALRAFILMPSDPPGLRAPLAWQLESSPIGGMSHATHKWRRVGVPRAT